MQRAFAVYGDARYERLALNSVGIFGVKRAERGYLSYGSLWCDGCCRRMEARTLERD